MLIFAVIGIALFWTANAWVLTLSTPFDKVVEYSAQGLTAITPVARAYWGWGNLIVIATAFTGLTAIYIGSVQGASRVIFALARHRLLPAPLARLSGAERVPKAAVLVVVLTCVTLGGVSLAILQNGLDSFVWWSNAMVFFAALTFTGVNIANLLYFRRILPGQFEIARNLIVPILGVIMNLYLIYAAFFSLLRSAPFRTGRSIVIVCIVLFAMQLLATMYVRFFRRDLLQAAGPIGIEPRDPRLNN